MTVRRRAHPRALRRTAVGKAAIVLSLGLTGGLLATQALHGAAAPEVARYPRPTTTATTVASGGPATATARTSSSGTASGVPVAGRSASATSPAAATNSAATTDLAGRIVLHAYDMSGNRLGWKAFRAVQTAGHGSDGVNDMLLDPDTLTTVSGWPLYDHDGDPALDRPARPAALSLAWPSTQGYSTVILDLPGPGTYVFNQLLAQDLVRRTLQAWQARPDYRPSRSFRERLRRAQDELTTAQRAVAEADRGRLSAIAYDDAVAAQLQLLTEYGAQSGQLRPDAERVWGFTTGSTTKIASTVAAASGIVGGRRGAASLRIVFDPDRSPASYQAAVATARRAGLRVVGQLLDSTAMAGMSLARWRSRVADYVTTLPNVDVWEVGNEVNGHWLGRDVPAKIAYAADYVKARGGRTMLTLYWQLGEDTSTTSMFTWAQAHLSSATRGSLDEIGLSLYPEQAPMGVAFDRVVTTLHRSFLHQRVAVTELGYGSPDLSHLWWWGSATDPTGDARNAVASLYSRAIIGYAYSGGGTYWWYFPQDAPLGSRLWQTFATAYRQSTTSP